MAGRTCGAFNIKGELLRYGPSSGTAFGVGRGSGGELERDGRYVTTGSLPDSPVGGSRGCLWITIVFEARPSLQSTSHHTSDGMI